MNKCLICKHNVKGYCTQCNSRVIPLQGVHYCLYFKTITKTSIKNQIKKKSIKQEKKLAKDLGAQRVPQSGAQITSPNDMVLGNYVIESKATKGKSISLKKEWLDQLKQSPINYGKIPTLVLDFTKTNDRYIVMDIKDFKKVINTEDLITDDEQIQICNNMLNDIYEEKDIYNENDGEPIN